MFLRVNLVARETGLVGAATVLDLVHAHLLDLGRHTEQAQALEKREEGRHVHDGPAEHAEEAEELGLGGCGGGGVCG